MDKNYLAAAYNACNTTESQRWAMLMLPDTDLPDISAALEDYFCPPEKMCPTKQMICLHQAANMASLYFDAGEHGAAKTRKYYARLNALENSANKADGSLMFIHHNKTCYGYVRVLPVDKKQWQAYRNHKITEAELDSCDPNKLSTGEAVLFFQAIVFPNAPDLHKPDKKILQEASIAGLIGNYIAQYQTGQDIDVYFTAFHPYTDNLAERLNIDAKGLNKHNHTIYGFTIGQDANKGTLGHYAYERLTQNKHPHPVFADDYTPKDPDLLSFNLA